MKYFVVPYFGNLPNYFQLWLDSCGFNSKFKWLLITDCDLTNYCIPSNVRVEKFTLSDIKKIFQIFLKIDIKLENAYKLCDYRPIFWLLLDHYKINYEFWGYCDTDVIFGNLSKFITDEILHNHNKIYVNGHLTLMQSSEIVNHAFLFDGSKFSWKEIFSHEKNIGFDEHHGINKIFKKQKFLQYNGDETIADVLPQFSKFTLSQPKQNKKGQYFTYEDGSVFQNFFHDEKLVKKEYAYIHFQKRKMDVDENLDENQFLIFAGGFQNLTKNNIERCTSIQYSSTEKKERLKYTLRFYKNRFRNGVSK